MARKVNKPAPPPAPPDNELDILHPDRQLNLRGQMLTVREFRHLEWLRLLPTVEPLIAAMAATLSSGRTVSYEDALALMATHIDTLSPLVVQASGITPTLWEQLTPDEGELLLMTFWGANGRFFVGRAVNRVAVARSEANLWAGAASTPPSSTTATASSASASTPSAS